MVLTIQQYPLFYSYYNNYYNKGRLSQGRPYRGIYGGLPEQGGASQGLESLNKGKDEEGLLKKGPRPPHKYWNARNRCSLARHSRDGAALQRSGTREERGRYARTPAMARDIKGTIPRLLSTLYTTHKGLQLSCGPRENEERGNSSTHPRCVSAPVIGAVSCIYGHHLKQEYGSTAGLVASPPWYIIAPSWRRIGGGGMRA